MICTKCGTHLPDGTVFCPSCGNQLISQPTASIMPVDPFAPAMGAPTMGSPVMGNPSMSTPPKKSKAPLFIGLGILALVITIVAIVLVILFTGDDDNKKSKKVSSTETTATNTEGSSTENGTEETTEEFTEEITEEITEETTTETTTTTTDSDFDFEKSLNENYQTLSNSIEGTVHQFEDYTLTIPDTWTTGTTNSICPDNSSAITFSNSFSISTATKMYYLKQLCQVYIESGYRNLEFGNLNANGKEGYYIEYDVEYGSETIHAYIPIFISPSDDKLFLTVVTTSDINSSYYDDALAIACSIEIQ